MKPNPDLHLLIKSLSKSEKRYFKIYASQYAKSDKSNYLRLFDAIDRQAEYDEAALKKRFSKEKFIRHLSSEKNYLFQMIMKSLRAYQREGSLAVNLGELILESDILEQKGLYKRSDKVLAKAEKLAEESESHWVMLEILDRRRVLLKARELKQPHENLLDLIRRKEETLDKITNRYFYQDLYDELFLAARRRLDGPRRDILEKLKGLYEDPVLLAEHPPASFFATLFSLNLKALFHRLNENRAASKEAFAKQVALWEAHPEMCRLHPPRHKIALSNYLAACVAMEDYAPIPAVIAKIKAIPDSTFNLAAENFQNVSLWELLYHFNTGKLEEAMETMPGIEAGLEKYGRKVNQARRLTLLYNMAMVHFMADQASPCLKYINQILDTGAIPHRRDIQRSAHLFQLILHLELGNFDLLEYLLRSSKRFFKQAGEPSLLESDVLAFCQAGLKEGRLPLPTKAWADLLAGEDAWTMAAGTAEIRCWAKARLAGRSIREEGFGK